jgi:hypothetical protein
MWVRLPCRNADVSSRYSSPPATAGDHMTKSASMRGAAACAMNASTLIAINA